MSHSVCTCRKSAQEERKKKYLKKGQTTKGIPSACINVKFVTIGLANTTNADILIRDSLLFQKRPGAFTTLKLAHVLTVSHYE